MGIVNVTPDSFSDGGDHATTDAAVAHGEQLIADGATFVDVGGESTRPGAEPVPIDVEMARVVPVVEALASTGRAIISVDTRKPAVAAAAIAAGAHLVNDVGGLRDETMVEVCASNGVPAVVMHMLGEPATMQRDPHYADVVVEVTSWLERQAQAAIRCGVPDVIVDPGIGFGKTLDHNVALLAAGPLSRRFPTLVGASRKRTVQQLAGLDSPRGSDVASVAVHLFAAQRGAAIVRVHDVAAHRQAFAVDRALRDR
jgi:dihydropteroate synthase